MQKGKRTKEEGPIKGFFMGLGGCLVFIGVVALFNGAVGSALVFGGIGGAIAWAASKFRDKNVVKW